MFNGTPLLNGRAGVLEFQVGTHNNPLIDRISYNGERADASVEALNIGGESIGSKAGAQMNLSVLDDALNRVSSIRADFGAIQNRLQSTVNNAAISIENISAANSRIRDADMAEETAELTKQNILSQAGTSVLAQANNSGAGALQLLQAMSHVT